MERSRPAPQGAPAARADPGFSAVILAAGKGTRMRSARHKVLHPVGGRPMLLHLLASLETLAPRATVIVAGDRRDQIAAAVGTRVRIVAQEPQLGTAHAVLQAEEILARTQGAVLILCGDVPLVRPETMQALLAPIGEDVAIAVLAFRPANPGSYGRIRAEKDGCIVKMVEARDASPAELAIPLCNSGLMAVRGDVLFPLLKEVGNDNAAREYYLPDIVAIAQARGLSAIAIEAEADEVLGVNSRADLALAEAAFQKRRRREIMAGGVTLVAPDTVFFSADTAIGADSVVEPFVVFGPGVTIGADVCIRSHSHIEGARVRDGAQVGPFARLRPGTVLEENSHVGNFVETKKTTLGAGAKANHLTYLGDATVGAGANIGAGTITCNYDGFNKFPTTIGAGAFIGSNSSLVAPVRIGKGAITGAGSTITGDVPDDALALTRAPLTSKNEWAANYRARKNHAKGD